LLLRDNEYLQLNKTFFTTLFDDESMLRDFENILKELAGQRNLEAALYAGEKLYDQRRKNKTQNRKPDLSIELSESEK
jgi:hypothetical protein